MKEIYSFDGNKFYHSVWHDRSATQKYKHSLLFPKNTYSPWLGDEEFLSIYNTIKDTYTLVDIYRCYELWTITKQLKDKQGDIIEVGVWRGGTGLLLAKGSNSDTKVYLCDTFEGVVKAGKEDNIYKGGEHADTSESLVQKIIHDNDLKNCKIIKGVFPDQGASLIDSSLFKLCHIDVDVYQSALDIFEWVWPKLIVGGVVVFDDYGFAACEGITSLVNNLAMLHKDTLLIYNINGHAILIKLQ